MELAFIENPTLQEQFQLFDGIAKIKSDIAANGPDEVWSTMNEQLESRLRDQGRQVQLRENPLLAIR